MINNNTIFLEFWQQYQWPDVKPLYFRVYHDQLGNITKYSREDEPGDFIDVSPEEFAIGNMMLRVIDKKLTKPHAPRSPKLVPSDDGVPCHAKDITIIVDPTKSVVAYWKLR